MGGGGGPADGLLKGGVLVVDFPWEPGFGAEDFVAVALGGMAYPGGGGG